MSLKDDYDEAIEVTAKQLKRTVFVLMGVAIAGFFTGGFIQSTIAMAILLIGFFGAHRRHTCLLLTYAVIKISIMVIGLTGGLVLTTLFVSGNQELFNQVVSITVGDMLVFSTLVACITLLYTLYLAFVFRSVGLALRLRAFVRERRYLEETEDVETPEPAAPIPTPAPFPMPMMPYPQQFVMPQPVMQPGAPMPISFYPPMYMPVPQAAQFPEIKQ